jgi:hypothetical protein
LGNFITENMGMQKHKKHDSMLQDEPIKDNNGWINGNDYHPFYIQNKKYQKERIIVCGIDGFIFISNPCSNGFPIKNFWWKLIEYPVNLI